MIIVLNTARKNITFLGSFPLDAMANESDLLETVGDYKTVNIKDVLETDDKKLLAELAKFHQEKYTK